jgi:hypothetical protein
MKIVYLKGGAFDGKTYEKDVNDLLTIRIPHKNHDGKYVTDVYMKVVNENKIIDNESLEVYLYRETVEG